jgi:hypothetical protein
MPDDALMLFPPGLADRSRRITGIEWETRVKAAERPARPEPTTIALCFSLVIVDNLEVVGTVVETSLRQRKDASAMKTETVMSVRILLRDIDFLSSAG